MNSNQPTLNVGKVWRDMKKYRRLYLKALPAVFVLAYIIALGYPNYYKCTVTLAPEMNSAGSLGSLASLANSFGVNIGGAGGSKLEDAIVPNLYPDLMNSVDFRTSLFGVKVQRSDDTAPMTYYEYLRDYQKDPWWTAAQKAFWQLLRPAKEKDPITTEVNPFKLTPEQDIITSIVAEKINCEVDKKTDVITITIEDQDPLVVATMADSVKERLQDALTAYRTTKARHDLAYVEKLHQEAKQSYDHACAVYAEFMDAHQDIVLQSARQKQVKLENELQLQYNNYNAISAQLLAAKAKVQEETPAFTTLKRATVPLIKTGPRRGLISLGSVFVAFFLVTFWVMWKEDDLRPMFAGLN